MKLIKLPTPRYGVEVWVNPESVVYLRADKHNASSRTMLYLRDRLDPLEIELPCDEAARLICHRG